MGNAPKVARTKRYNDTIKASLTEFKIPQESWEQTTQACVKAKRVCKAEQKRKERKARAKGSLSVSLSSKLTCSICNRQFRDKIGLITHQRKYQRT